MGDSIVVLPLLRLIFSQALPVGLPELSFAWPNLNLARTFSQIPGG